MLRVDGHAAREGNCRTLIVLLPPAQETVMVPERALESGFDRTVNVKVAVPVPLGVPVNVIQVSEVDAVQAHGVGDVRVAAEQRRFRRLPRPPLTSARPRKRSLRHCSYAAPTSPPANRPAR